MTTDQPNERELRDLEEMLLKKLEGEYDDQDFIDSVSITFKETKYE